MGVLGGLLVKKPLFYDNYKTGVLYREFVSLEDIRETEAVFDQAVGVDDLLSLMNIRLGSPSSYGFLTYKNLLLTMWARHYHRIKGEKLKAMTLKQFLPFFEELLPGAIDPDSQPARKIPMELKTAFLNWLAAETGLKDYELSERLDLTFEDLFNEIETELGQVTAANIDPRFVHLFLLSSKK
jgi:hypothetical protein